jgi:hypothetical protein
MLKKKPPLSRWSFVENIGVPSTGDNVYCPASARLQRVPV